MHNVSRLCTLCLILSWQFLQAQTYPVTVNIHIKPPYSLFLSDYVTPGAEKLSVQIFLRNLERQNYKVKLRFRIEGENVIIRTKNNYVPQPIFLQGGLFEVLSGSDLAPYLNPDNLEFSGISRENYRRQNKLPEGLYRICIEVVDYGRDLVVSNVGCATAWMILNDPPIINKPTQAEKLRAVDPQQIFFQWTPRHTGSPNSAFTVQYEFSLVEIRPAGRNPNDAMNSTLPLYTTLTNQTSLLYGPSEPLLIPGQAYAFRIRAMDVEERDLFKNNGYSEVFMFTYGDDCPVPLNIHAEALNAENIRIAWDAGQGQTAFTVDYREKGNSSSWFEEESVLMYKNVTSLKPSTTYEYQIKAKCGSIYSAFSPIQTIVTSARTQTDFTCGNALEAVTLNTSLKASLVPGDIIKSGDFSVTISQASGGNGIFSGEGLVVVPFMNHMKVRTGFTNIKVNEENRVIQGKIRIIGGTVQLLDDATRSQIKNVITEVNTAVETANQYIDRAEAAQAQVIQAIATLEHLPEDAQRLIDEGESLIDRGKELLAAGNTAEGQSLIERGTQAIQSGLDKVSAVANGINEYVNRFKAIVEQALNGAKEKSTAEADSLNILKTRSVDGYEEMRSQYNAEREGLMTNSNDRDNVIVFDVDETNNSYPHRDINSNLSKAVGTYLELERLIQDGEKIITHIQDLLKPENCRGFIRDVENSIKQMGAGLWSDFITGKLTNISDVEHYVENYVKDYLKNKLNEFNSERHEN